MPYQESEEEERNKHEEVTKEKVVMYHLLIYGCSFKFKLKVCDEESIVNAPRITEHGSAVENYKLTSGAFQGWQKTCFFNLKQNLQFFLF
jgi:hypothetical protein